MSSADYFYFYCPSIWGGRKKNETDTRRVSITGYVQRELRHGTAYNKMAPITNFFSDKYKRYIEQVTVKHLEDFKNAKSVNDQIAYLYPHVRGITIAPFNYGKSHDAALTNKNLGNTHFQKRELQKAIESYTNGIIKCPQDNLESKKLLCILTANRSACLFELEEYEKTLEDIKFILDIGSYPLNLKYKLHFREAKCYTYSRSDQDLALASYNHALQLLNCSNIGGQAREQKRREIYDAIKEDGQFASHRKKLKSKRQKSTSHTVKNTSYLHSGVTFKSEKNLGRYAAALEDIDVGTTIVRNQAYCAVLAADFTLTNCQSCMLAVSTPLPCKTCANVVYCSLQCQEDARKFHKYECGLHPALVETGASINCLMALRIVTQSSLDYFLSISQDTDKGRCFTASSELEQDNNLKNYLEIYNLCRNDELRSPEENFHYTIMSICLLRMLKRTDYFNVTTTDDILTKNETFIGGIILQNLQMLQFNAHEISELREAPPGPLDPPGEPNFKAIYIGGGLYPTLALFNHACDPSIVRYNIGSDMLVETIKSIREGEVIYENYGPIYSNMIRSERKKFLQDNYWFECKCKACIEDWPLFKEMPDSIIKIPCKSAACDSYILLTGDINNITRLCPKCEERIFLFPPLEALSKLENMLPEAENMYKRGNYDAAIKLYCIAMQIFSKHTVPPFPDWVKVQQRLRTAIVRKGNKSIAYLTRNPKEYN